MGRRLATGFGLAWLALVLGLAGCGSPEGRLKQAQELARQGRYSQAVEAYQALLQKHPRPDISAQIHLGMAQSQVKLDRLADACSEADKALLAGGQPRVALEAAFLLADLSKRTIDSDSMSDAAEVLCARGAGNPRAAQAVRALADALLGARPKMGSGPAGQELRAALGKIAACGMLDAALRARLMAAAASAAAQQAAPAGPLDATQIAVGSVTKSANLDRSVFTRVTEASDGKLASPDGKRLLWRQRKGSYTLLISDADGKHVHKLKGTKNGYRPSWSPDGGQILYTAINWTRVERAIYAYDLKSGKPVPVFKSRRGVGALAAWSPDGSKIVFTYRRQLWLVNRNGIGLTLLNLSQTVPEAQILAWDSSGMRLAYQAKGSSEFLIIDLVPRS